MLDVKRYLAMTCKWKKQLTNQSDEFGPTYDSEEITLKCFYFNNAASFGKSSFVINNQDIITRSTTTYIVIAENIKEGDLLDNMTVNVVDTHHDFNGKYLFSVCGVI